MMTDTVLDIVDVSGLQKEKKRKKASSSENLENTQEVYPKAGRDLNIVTDERDIDEAIDDELDLDFKLPQKKKKNINELESGIPIEYDGDDEEEDTQFDTVLDFGDFSGLQKEKEASTSENLENTQEVDPKDGEDLNISIDESDIDEAIDDKLDLDLKKKKERTMNELLYVGFCIGDKDYDDELKEEENIDLLNLKEKLIRCLQDLEKTADFTNFRRSVLSSGKAHKALILIYWAGLNEMVFTPEEEKLLGSLLSSAITPIQIHIRCFACTCRRTRLENSVLMKRSAIEFLAHKYAHFPVDNVTLGEKLQERDIRESMEILDEHIVQCCDRFDSDEGESDRELAGKEQVPDSHVWWKLD